MRKSLSVLLVSTLILTGCGLRESVVNPFNWFGRSQSEPIAQANEVNPLIPTRSGLFARRAADEDLYLGRPFEEIIDLKVERVPGGAIIRATGRAARQGRYSVRLTPATEDETAVDGVLTYRLEGVRPDFATPVGTEPTREVTAARKVTDQTLRGVNAIRVEGTLNARTARR